MAIRDYTARIEAKRIKDSSYDALDYTPIAVPAGATLPETTQQTMARMMLNSGMINLDDYHKMIGVTYDGDYKDADEDFRDFGEREDRWKQSAFAEYEEYMEYDNYGRLETQSQPSEVLSDSQASVDTGASGNADDVRQDSQTGSSEDIKE